MIHEHDACDWWNDTQDTDGKVHQCNLPRNHKGYHICKCGKRWK